MTAQYQALCAHLACTIAVNRALFLNSDPGINVDRLAFFSKYSSRQVGKSSENGHGCLWLKKFQTNLMENLFLKGTYWRGKCGQFSWIKEGSGCPLPRGSYRSSKTYADCQTRGVAYLACGAFYIGKTKRTFARRIQDHLYYLDAGLLYTPICKHIGHSHSFDPSFISFFALEVILEAERGGDFDKKILQQEAKWIFNQKAVYLPGMNTSFFQIFSTVVLDSDK